MKFIVASCLSVFFAAALAAEEVYITDQLKVGLHEDKSLDSAIIKVVPTGTALEVVKREDQLTFVRDSSGASGWINNDYLKDTAPSNQSLKPLQQRADDLENRLNEAKEEKLALQEQLKNSTQKMPTAARDLTQLKATHAKLNQDFKAEKLKNGKLQIELTELRKRVGQDSDSDTLYSQISTLEEEKKTLEIELARTLDKYGAGEGGNGGSAGRLGADFNPGARNMMIYLAITLVLGLFAGAYLLDLVNRKRHGGFRI